MSVFTPAELEFLHGQLLGRLATVGRDGQPHVVPVGYRVDSPATSLSIGGHGFGRSKKWRDLQHNPRLAFVIDDLVTVEPWTPRGIEIRGRAILRPHGGEIIGEGFSEAWLTIEISRIVAWGIDGHFMAPPNARSVELGADGVTGRATRMDS